MSTATLASHGVESPFIHMRGPLVGSALFHVCVAFFILTGLPHIKKDPLDIDAAIPVEFITEEEISESVKPKPVKPQKAEAPPEPPKVKPKAPKVTAKAPPKLSEIKPPELKEEVATPREVTAPTPMPKQERAEIPKTAPKPKPQSVQELRSFDSVLRNLAPSEPEIMQTPQQAPVTSHELSTVIRQLHSCWNVKAGARYAENLVVDVRLYMNPDRTVRQARILDMGRYNRDSYFRAAADSAIRAIHHPRCTPLKLPVEKYEQWKVIDIQFDPREILQ